MTSEKSKALQQQYPHIVLWEYGDPDTDPNNAPGFDPGWYWWAKKTHPARGDPEHGPFATLAEAVDDSNRFLLTT